VWAGGPSARLDPLPALRASRQEVRQVVRGRLAGDARVLWLVDWIGEHTHEGEPVLFLPNDASYYYLTRRPNPTRFALSHQMVTDAHRAEALAGLRANPPRFVVRDERMPWVDDVGERATLGAPMQEWIEQGYTEVVRENGFRIAAPRSFADGTP
jgi:hypothetical protein